MSDPGSPELRSRIRGALRLPRSPNSFRNIAIMSESEQVKESKNNRRIGAILFPALALPILLLLASCGGRSAEPAGPPREVRIEWLGNQAFRISSSIGTSILTDPFADGMGGRSLPSPLKPDIVLISHERPEANNINAMDNQPVIFRGSVGTGVNNATGIRIRGIPTFRNPDVETVDRMNIVYSWQMDGIRFCFLGALENPLSSYQVSQLGTVDVLFLPVGGSLSESDRQTVVSQIRPRVIIPMGRGAGGWSTGQVVRAGGRSTSFSRASLPLQTTTLIFGS